MSVASSLLKPPRLRAGARVALIAPAGPLSQARIEASLARCRSLGFEPVLGRSSRERTGYFAGADAQRAADLDWAFRDATIDAVWALRGGYGAVRLLQHVHLAHVHARPRAFIGFSDNTTLHLAMQQAGVVSYHGPHPGAEFPLETRACFERVLCHAQAPGELPLRAGDPAPVTLRNGAVEAPLVGGNLSLLAAACGTGACLRAEGRILFVEDVNEPAYRVDRAFMQLLLSGALDKVRGLAFGRFTPPADTTDERPISDVLLEVAERLAVPAVMDLPIGHVQHNWTLPLGVRAVLDANAATLTISESAVE